VQTPDKSTLPQVDLSRLAHINSLQRDGEAQALYGIALQAPRGKEIVELGTFHGYTAGVLALAAEKIGAHVTTIDDFQERRSQRLPAHIGARRVRDGLVQAGLDVRVVESDSRAVPAGISDVGMLWIDSTHTAEQLRSELAVWLPFLGVGAIIAFHDYGGANTPQLKPVIDETFGHNRRWVRIGGFYTIIAFKRVR